MDISFSLFKRMYHFSLIYRAFYGLQSVNKGKVSKGEIVQVKQLGGKIDNIESITEDKAELIDNEHYLFFLEN